MFYVTGNCNLLSRTLTVPISKVSRNKVKEWTGMIQYAVTLTFSEFYEKVMDMVMRKFLHQVWAS